MVSPESLVHLIQHFCLFCLSFLHSTAEWSIPGAPGTMLDMAKMHTQRVYHCLSASKFLRAEREAVYVDQTATL